MTITQLIAKVWPRLGVASTNDFFSSATITYLLNDGYRDFVSLTRCLRKFTLTDIVADTQSYDLPSDILQAIWFGYDGEGITPVSVRSLDLLDEQWVGQASGTPSLVTVGLDGMEKFYLYSPPSASSTALSAPTTEITDFEDWEDNVLIFYEYEIGTDLTAGQTPDLETPFQWALIYYTLWKCFESEGDLQDLELAALWQRRYFEKVEEKKSFLSEIKNISVGSGSSSSSDDDTTGDEKAYPYKVNFYPVANMTWALKESQTNNWWSSVCWSPERPCRAARRRRACGIRGRAHAGAGGAGGARPGVDHQRDLALHGLGEARRQGLEGVARDLLVQLGELATHGCGSIQDQLGKRGEALAEPGPLSNATTTTPATRQPSNAVVSAAFLRGRNPVKRKPPSPASPLATAAVSTAEAPGSTVSGSPAAAARATTQARIRHAGHAGIGHQSDIPAVAQHAEHVLGLLGFVVREQTGHAGMDVEVEDQLACVPRVLGGDEAARCATPPARAA